MFFDDRRDAGRKMTEIVKALPDDFSSWDVVGIARGGVIIAAEVARMLGKTPKAICVEDLKLGEEQLLVATSLGSGMIFGVPGMDGQIGTFISDLNVISGEDVPEFLAEVAAKGVRLMGNDKVVYGEKILLCDDGLVTGRSLLAAISALRYAGVQEVAAVIPVVLPWAATQEDFRIITWRVTKMTRPATGLFYRSFSDTPDEDVITALEPESVLV